MWTLLGILSLPLSFRPSPALTRVHALSLPLEINKLKKILFKKENRKIKSKSAKPSMALISQDHLPGPSQAATLHVAQAPDPPGVLSQRNEGALLG